MVRHQYNPGHHNTETFFPAEPHECNSNSFTPGGTLAILDATAGKVRTLVDLPKGVARDPEVSFDGKRILFSMRISRPTATTFTRSTPTVRASGN